MKTEIEAKKSEATAIYQAKKDYSGNWYVCRDNRTYCEMTWVCGDPEENAKQTANTLNEREKLLADRAALLAACINADKVIQELGAGQDAFLGQPSKGGINVTEQLKAAIARAMPDSEDLAELMREHPAFREGQS